MARRDMVINLRLSYRPDGLRSVMGGRNRATGTRQGPTPDGASPPVRRISPAPRPSRPVPTTRASSVLGRQRVAAIRSPAVKDGGSGWGGAGCETIPSRPGVHVLTLPVKVLWVNGLVVRRWLLGAGVGRSEGSIGLLSLQRRRDIGQIPRGANVAVLVPSSLDRPEPTGPRPATVSESLSVVTKHASGDPAELNRNTGDYDG